MTGGRVVILGKTGKNFAAGMSGGIAYVLDEDNDLYMRTNKSMVFSEEVTNKYDVLELKEMIKEHVTLTNSEKGKEILDHFSEYLPKFKKVIPLFLPSLCSRAGIKCLNLCLLCIQTFFFHLNDCHLHTVIIIWDDFLKLRQILTEV